MAHLSQSFRAASLAIASLAFGALFACALPFAALAAVAARSLSARLAYALVAATWIADQTLGFTVRHYPLDAPTLAWGAVIGIAALAATAAARRAPTLTLEFVTAFVIDQGALLAYGIVRHETGGFTPAIVGQMLLVNLTSLAILAPLAFAPALIARMRRNGTRA